MSLKSNFLYNSFLTLSQYIIGFITFPYVTRVLGVENFGTVSFIDGTINYFALFVLLGIAITGIREVSKYKNSPKELSVTYSSLQVLSILFLLIVLCVYFVSIWVFSSFEEHWKLFVIGATKLIATAFLVEWFYKGIEDFKYITIRNILIKVGYVIGVFLLIKAPEDYHLYFVLTMAVVVVNAAINIVHVRRFVRFSLKNVSIHRYFKPACLLGSYMVLTSMYTTFNIMYLGTISTVEEVGYYTTALKIYTVILGFYTAFTTVMVPRMSYLFDNHQMKQCNSLISKSYDFLLMFSIPVIVVTLFFAPEFIQILSGDGYSSAIRPFRIIMPLLLIVGCAQILSRQILIPMRLDKSILCASMIGAGCGVITNILLVPRFGSTGTAIVLVLSETIVTLYYIYVTQKHGIAFPIRKIFRIFVTSAPYLLVVYICKVYISNAGVALGVVAVCCSIYFIVLNVFLLRNATLISLLHSYCKISYADRK